MLTITEERKQINNELSQKVKDGLITQEEFFQLLEDSLTPEERHEDEMAEALWNYACYVDQPKCGEYDFTEWSDAQIAAGVVHFRERQRVCSAVMADEELQLDEETLDEFKVEQGILRIAELLLDYEREERLNHLREMVSHLQESGFSNNNFKTLRLIQERCDDLKLK